MSMKIIPGEKYRPKDATLCMNFYEQKHAAYIVFNGGGCSAIPAEDMRKCCRGEGGYSIYDLHGVSLAGCYNCFAPDDLEPFLTPTISPPMPACPFTIDQELKVIISGSLDGGDFSVGDRFIVRSIASDSIIGEWKKANKAERSHRYGGDRAHTWFIEEEHWHKLVPISSPTTFMGKVVSYLKRKAMTENERALRDAGFKNVDGDITEEGSVALREIMFEKMEAELVALAKEVIAEEKKEKDCAKC